MRFLLTVLFLTGFQLFAQHLEVGPIYTNPSLFSKEEVYTIKAGGNTFDSTIIYLPDTLSLPFFDDFSSNKFQQYQTNFNLPGIYSTIHYQLMDVSETFPLPNNQKFTEIPTFHRYYNLTTATFSDTLLPQVNLKYSNLSSYPVEYEALSLYPAYFIYDTIGGDLNQPDTVWIQNPNFIQDSARQFFAPINDPLKLWVDNYVYHNFRYGLNPRSLGVASFDGLNERGYPYQIGTSITNFADRLTSKPLNLSTYSAVDSLYLSFLYQPEGLGDVPEATDSLVLEFYAPDMNQWFHVWSVAGSAVHPFKSVHIPVKESKFLKKGFQFRFKNYGSLSGALDHFHIDYVHLRPQSFYEDTLFKDFAFVYPLNSLLKTYTSVPWDHYKNSTTNKMTDSLKVMVHNGSQNPENYLNGSVSFEQNGTIQGSFTLPGFTLAENQINYAPRTTHTSYHNLTSGAEFAKTLSGNQQVFEVKASASAQFPNFQPNDSTSFYQDFYNYYAYDDGSAEAAFGPTGTQSRLAIRFDPYEADSIIGVAFHFVPTVVNTSNNLFLITVWDDNNGKPGNVLYQDDAFSPRSPIYGTNYNQFHTYYFTDTVKIAVGTTFHIGWRQLDGQRLNLGLDRNIDNSSKIKYSVDGGATWLGSPFGGTAMVRPIFSTGLDNVLSTPDLTIEKSTISVYPNPVSDQLYVKLNNELFLGTIQIFDLFGKQLMETTSDEINVNSFASGVYLLGLKDVQAPFIKFIKQ